MRKSKKFLAVFSALVILVSSLTMGYPAAMAASKKNIVKSMSVSTSSVSIKKGKSQTVKATVKTSKKVKASDLKVTVKSSNKDVATVKITKNPSKKGKSGTTSIKITAKKAGTAKITVTAKNLSTKKKTVKKTITVKVPKNKTTTTTKPTTTKPTTTTTKPTTTKKAFSNSDYTVKYETVQKTVKFKYNKDTITKEELEAQGYTVEGDEATRTCSYGKATFTFSKLPTTLAELKNFSLKSDVRTVNGTEIDYGMLRPAVASVLAMHTFKATNRTDTTNPICDMFDYLNGPSTTTALSNVTKQFINGQLIDNPDLKNCYFQGATPENAYTPSTPYTIVVEEGPYYIPAKTTVTGSRPTTYMAFIKFAGTDEGERYIDVFKSSDGNWYSWNDQCKNLLASVKAPQEQW